MSGQACVDKIKADYPDFRVVIVKAGAILTMDMRFDRVRVFVDDSGTVDRAPRVG